MEELNQVKEALSGVMKEKETLLTQLKELEGKKEDLSVELNQVKEEKEELTSQLKELEEKNQEEPENSRIEELTTQLRKAEEEKEELEKELKEQRDVRNYSGSFGVVTLRKENEDLRKRVLELIVSRENALKSVYNLQSQLSFKQCELTSCEHQIGVLSSYLEEKNREIGKLKGELCVLNSYCVCGILYAQSIPEFYPRREQERFHSPH